jgi:hypothetical protein
VLLSIEGTVEVFPPPNHTDIMMCEASAVGELKQNNGGMVWTRYSGAFEVEAVAE